MQRRSLADPPSAAIKLDRQHLHVFQNDLAERCAGSWLMREDDVDPTVSGRNVGKLFGTTDMDGRGSFALRHDGRLRRPRFWNR